uniref:NAD(P)-binding protein n=1 Tax=Mycena chlorophos TaxID=658473 RepID=A0ABQ0M0Z9_MYCCL|nr:NAD(P)-binding protein [Mycena chlorophos]
MTSAAHKVWLITGTSSGFGECLVKIVLERGDRVIATARTLSKIQHFLSSPHAENLRLLELDIISGEAAIQSAIATALEFWGHIDVLVNNAGTGAKGILEETGSSELRSQFLSNVFAPVEVTLAVLPHMRVRRSGTIVMICSRSSWKPEQPGIGMYASSKAALRTYSETLAVEVAPFDMRVLIVEPAAFRTNTFNNMPYFVDRQIDDYNEMRAASQEWYTRMHAVIKGDPVKAMKAVADVVRGEGKAAGRPWPLYLPLGDLAYAGIKDKCNQMLRVVEEWKDVSTGLDVD